jgi:hypothetical protein
MAAVFPTLGPVEHFIRPDGTGPWLYLGTAKVSPEEEREDFLLPLMSDIGGRSVPHDYVRDRSKSFVTTTLSRFNRSTYRRLRLETVTAPAVGDLVETPILNGTPILKYSHFELLLLNHFTANGINVPSEDQPKGRCYYHAIPRKFREDRAGSRSVEATILFECIGILDETFVTTRRFDVYTEDPTYWGTVTPE